MIVLAFCVMLCLGGGVFCLLRWSQARHMQDTPTSKIRSAAQGYVELYGVLQAPDGEQLSGPLSAKPCLWWRFKIEERSIGEKGDWREVESGCSEALLSLLDGTGECLIDPRGAEVRVVVRDVWEGRLRHPLGQAKSGFLGWLSGGSRYRYTEERLHVGQPLYAIGDFRTSGGGRQSHVADAAQALVVREWKRDFRGLLQRFDSDANGQLDDKEWSRVRLAAKLEAEDRHRQASLLPAQNHLSKPGESQPFILSNVGEEELARRFYYEAAGYALACLVGAVLTAWELGVRTL